MDADDLLVFWLLRRSPDFFASPKCVCYRPSQNVIEAKTKKQKHAH
jgi:hypothetical protein